MTCNDCKYYCITDGTCRRNPPVIPAHAPMAMAVKAEFPRVERNWWCGECSGAMIETANQPKKKNR